MRIGRIAASTAVVLGTVTVLATGVGAQDDDDVVTMTIGLTQDIDSPNVTAGYLVSSFEVWNLQYATLTDKAADDFETIPGLAESWEASDDGLTYTYTLRDGLLWSDGEPLTADDVAYTINRSRDEEWLNHSSTVANLEATAVDDRTVEITSSVPDPKLPTMDVYIVPEHIYEPLSADDVLTYDGLDGVGSGPYTLSEWQPGQSWTMTANPNYYGWGDDGPQIDRIVFSLFENGEAMAAALRAGELDAAHDLPNDSFEQLEQLGSDSEIVTVAGRQGSFSELGINAGQSGLGDGHPALLDVTVRQAINRAIDRDTLVERILLGNGEVGTTISPSADPSWIPEVPEDAMLGFDPAAAEQLLDDAGYVDTNGDGIREMPDGSRDLTFRYAQLTDSSYEPAAGEFITGWLEDIGIATTVETYDQSALTDVIASGEYDLFRWAWTPYVDPDPMLSYFTCDAISTGVGSGYTNDANWCTEEYDALYAEQNVELDPDRRREIVHEMLLMMYEAAPYAVLFKDADLQAYRTDRFDGWTKQPAEVGPVMFSNTSPTYVNLTVSGSGSDGGIPTGVLIAAIAAVVILVGGGAVVALRRRGSREERE